MKLYTDADGRDKNAMTLKEMKSNEEPLPGAGQVYIKSLHETSLLLGSLFQYIPCTGHGPCLLTPDLLCGSLTHSLTVAMGKICGGCVMRDTDCIGMSSLVAVCFISQPRIQPLKAMRKFTMFGWCVHKWAFFNNRFEHLPVYPSINAEPLTPFTSAVKANEKVPLKFQ